MVCSSFVFFNACEKDKDEEEDLCSYLTTCSDKPCISVPCSSGHSTVSNINYDAYGRPTTFNFSITCGSKIYKGSVYSVVYNHLGEATSYSATINGKNCHY
jgi:hypothetical protein